MIYDVTKVICYKEKRSITCRVYFEEQAQLDIGVRQHDRHAKIDKLDGARFNPPLISVDYDKQGNIEAEFHWRHNAVCLVGALDGKRRVLACSGGE